MTALLVGIYKAYRQSLNCSLNYRVAEWVKKRGGASKWLYVNTLLKNGGVAQMVERSLSMREVPGSMPGTSTYIFWLVYIYVANGLSGLNLRTCTSDKDDWRWSDKCFKPSHSFSSNHKFHWFTIAPSRKKIQIKKLNIQLWCGELCTLFRKKITELKTWICQDLTFLQINWYKTRLYKSYQRHIASALYVPTCAANFQ